MRTKNDMVSSSVDFEEMTLFYRRFMKFIAVLPFDVRSYNNPLTVLSIAYFTASTFIHCGMFVLYIVNKTGTPAIDTICETVLVLGVYGRYHLLLPRRRELASLLDECQQIWEQCDDDARRIVRPFERKVRLLFQCFFGSCIFITASYSASAIGLTLEAARKAVADNETHLPAKYFLPYKWFADGAENSWPGYKINFAVQVLISFNAAAMSSTVDTAAPLLIMIGAGYFRALQLHLARAYAKILDNKNDQADRELVSCSQMHQRILNYCSRIDKLARSLFLEQLLCTGYNTSLVGIKLAGTDPDRYKYAPIAILNLSQLFICQWAPDILIDESTAISTAVYSVSAPWMSRRLGKALLLMITRAQQPVQMTAAGVVYLSLENFASMLKGAVSFFTVLRNVMA